MSPTSPAARSDTSDIVQVNPMHNGMGDVETPAAQIIDARPGTPEGLAVSERDSDGAAVERISTSASIVPEPSSEDLPGPVLTEFSPNRPISRRG